jgi:hypothetical protein
LKEVCSAFCILYRLLYWTIVGVRFRTVTLVRMKRAIEKSSLSVLQLYSWPLYTLYSKTWLRRKRQNHEPLLRVYTLAHSHAVC